ncbi:MAG: prolyl oligopeptidase family serine peptidase [Arachidicoccus sp.]|nr:prolyl oligopeptidase family serine peptidase [Arachidicoccus sp.]
MVLAFAHVRGGGEKGNGWYLGGKKTTKPNTWKDFNACTKWLIKNKYTLHQKFDISGASAGDVLIDRGINASGNSVLLDVNYAGGHFGDSTLDEQYVQMTKKYVFLLRQTRNPKFLIR